MKTIPEYLLDDVRNIPRSKAVADRNGAWDYGTLGRISGAAADQIRAFFRENGLSGPLMKYHATCVGVILPRKKEVLAAFLGIMMSGNAYVFSAPDAPRERLDWIIGDADIRLILTDRKTAENLALPGHIRCLYMEDLENVPDTGIPAFQIHHDSPAYITYTSGSTGKPKGAIDTYDYIENHVNARHAYYTPSADESVGSMVSFSYAASTYDLFSGIRAGCGLYIFHEEEMLDRRLLENGIIENNITAMFMIPSMIPVVFGGERALPLRCIVTAGEKMKKVPELPLKIVEIYGSSEAAAVISRVADPADPWDLLGTPVPGVTLFLLDERGNLVTEAGQTGELCVVSDALTLGYMNLDEVNREKLTECPFMEGRKMYRSGDLMCMDASGNYYYRGRKDHMVKINGQRAEMGEIEYAVAAYPGIRDAVCTVITRNGTDLLVCYYTLKEAVLSNPPEREALIRHTAARVPGFMVPGYWVRMERFPVNINGKTDRGRLPEPDLSSFCKQEPPQNYLESRLLEIAGELLPEIAFGVTDDMRRLGMDSVKAVRFAAKAAQYDARITATVVSRFGNIRDILSAPGENLWFHTPYDRDKPVLVLIHGIVPVSGYAMLCDDWNSLFNLLIIGPLTDHIEREPGICDYDALVAYYGEKLDEMLPEGARVACFAGFSFGGQLAVSLAEKMYRRTGNDPFVLMGDTLIQRMTPGRVLPELDADDPHIRAISERGRKYGNSPVNEPLETVIRKQNLVVKLLNTIRENLKYEGPVIYLDAQQDYDPMTEAAKVGVVRSFYKNLMLFEFQEFFHNDLYLSREMLPFYRNLFRQLMAGTRKERG